MEFLNFNSVELLPNAKASAAFMVDSGKVFREGRRRLNAPTVKKNQTGFIFLLYAKFCYLCNAVLTARHIDCSYLPPNYHIEVKMNKSHTKELTP